MRLEVFFAVLVGCGSEVVNPRPQVEYASGTQPNAPWPVFRHDVAFTSRTTVNGARRALERWKLDTGAPIGTAAPVVAADGTIYIGNSAGILSAIDPHGSLVWKKTIGAIEGAPAIAADGAIYVGSDDAQVHVIAPDGSPIASSLGTSSIQSSVIVDGAGVAYFSTSAPLARNCSAARGARPTCGTASPAGAVPPGCPFLIDGNRLYTDRDASAFGVLGAIGANGTLYTLSFEGARVEAHAPDGTWLWAADLATSIVNGASRAPFIALGPSFVYVLRDGALHAVGPSGKAWSTIVGSPSAGALAVDGEGVAYFGTDDGHVYAVDATGHTLFTIAIDAPVRSSPAIGADGTLYIGADDGYLHAIGP